MKKKTFQWILGFAAVFLALLLCSSLLGEREYLAVGMREAYFGNEKLWEDVKDVLISVKERTGARYFSVIKKEAEETEKTQYVVLIEIDNDDRSLKETVTYNGLSELMNQREAGLIERVLKYHAEAIEVGNTIAAEDTILFYSEKPMGDFDSMVCFYENPDETPRWDHHPRFEQLEENWYLFSVR